MAQKHKKQKAPEKQLSPEKYIKSQARNLPIYECMINTEWESTKICSVLVSRQHNNGNFSWVIYLVDLFCMGVKDSYYIFNQSEYEYNTFKKKYFPQDYHETIPYTLAHNIIFAGYEFAAEYDLKPCKDFLQLTQYFLNEDNDNVELIEIECGRNNMPVVISGPDNQQESNRLYNHLVHKVGKGKFIYEEVNDLFEDEFDEEEYEEDIPIEEYIYTEPLTERLTDVERFKELLNDTSNKNNDENAAELLYICNRLFYNYYSLEKIEFCRDKYLQFLDVEMNDGVISPELKGTEITTHDDFIEGILDDIHFDEGFSTHNFKKLANKHPDIPLFSYLELQQLNIEDAKASKIKKYLNDALSIYPNYMMLKLENDKYLSLEKKECLVINEKLLNQPSLLNLYKNRSTIHSFEFNTYINALEAYFVSKDDILSFDSMLHALQILFPELDDTIEEIELYCAILKLEFCKKIYC